MKKNYSRLLPLLLLFLHNEQKALSNDSLVLGGSSVFAGLALSAIYRTIAIEDYEQISQQLVEEANTLLLNKSELLEATSLITPNQGLSDGFLQEKEFYALAKLLRSKEYIFLNKYSFDSYFSNNFKSRFQSYSIKLNKLIIQLEEHLQIKTYIWSPIKTKNYSLLETLHNEAKNLEKEITYLVELITTHNEYFTLYELIETIKDRYENDLHLFYNPPPKIKSKKQIEDYREKIVEKLVEQASNSNNKYHAYAQPLRNYIALLHEKLPQYTHFSTLHSEAQRYAEKLPTLLQYIEKSWGHSRENIKDIGKLFLLGPAMILGACIGEPRKVLDNLKNA